MKNNVTLTEYEQYTVKLENEKQDPAPSRKSKATGDDDNLEFPMLKNQSAVGFPVSTWNCTVFL